MTFDLLRTQGVTLATAAIIGFSVLLISPAASYGSDDGVIQQQGGQFMMGPGQGIGYGMSGYGQGMGYGMIGPGRGGDCFRSAAAERTLSVDDVTKILDGRLAMQGNPRLKIGKVVEQDDDTIIAEIVTVDDSLVERLVIDRETGRRAHIN